MSIPVGTFSVPPPRLDVPPPVAIPSTVPPPQLFGHPPPYAPPTLPAVDKPPPPLPATDKPPPPYGPMTTLPPMNVPPPYPVTLIDVRSAPPPSSFYSAPQGYSAPQDYSTPPGYSAPQDYSVPTDYSAPQDYSSINYNNYNNLGTTASCSTEWQTKGDSISFSSGISRTGSHSERDIRTGRESIDRYSRGSSKRSYSPSRDKSYDRDREREKDKRYRERRHSRSPSRQSRDSRRSPSHLSHRERERSYRQRFDERQEYEQKRREYERRHSPSRIRDYRSHSRAASSVSRRLRSPSRLSVRSDTRDFRNPRLPSRTREMSHVSNVSHVSQATRPPKPALSASTKPLSDREKILEEYRKNYCHTSDDFIKKMTQWSKEYNSDEEETSKIWYRSSPAELYYKQVEGGPGVEQTPKLEKICDTFFQQLINRGRKARPKEDELPPLKPSKVAMCKHSDEEGTSSSESEDECLDEEGLQGYTDRIMLELQRKQSHPRRLHPEMWFNNTGEMNGGPLCRCSARARRQGMRHGVYASEESFPKCIPTKSNIDKLYHYRITVSPPTNFLIKSPTIISHDEHEFLFSGFSMFSHYKLAKLPTCKVIRFNIEYTILYVEEPPPQNFTVQELNLFEEFLFYELLELVDLDLGKGTDTTCSQFHFMPRFVRYLPDGGCEVLSMCEVLKYLIAESGLLIPPGTLKDVHAMDHFTWQKFVDRIKGMIVTYPGKKPCSVRVDQLDRSPPTPTYDDVSGCPTDLNTYYPEIVHFGIRPPQLSYAGNPEYQKAWRYYVKYRHLVANMAKPTYKERQKLAAKEAKLSEMRTQSKMKRDVTVAISSEGFHTTGLMCDVVQHAMLIPVLVRHLRFHKSLDSLETKIGYKFKQRALLQTALTHPSYRENFGTNPDHARNSLTNCGIRQPEYGDRRIHYTRKKGIVTLINIMSRFGRNNETESDIKHNERLEFLGDAVVEFLSSIHLFRMFPGLAEGGLATYRASIVQNQHLAQLAKNIELEHYMLYAHGSDLCREVVMRHAMANCFEALMGSLFLDAGIEANAPGKEHRHTYSIQVEVADRVFALALWHNQPDLLEVWVKERAHPLQEQEPLGDRKYIKDFEFLQQLTNFETSIGIQFKHIRLLARAFTDRSVGFTHLTLGSNQRLEFLGDTVLQLVVSDRLYRHFPDHHEGHLSLLRSSLVNNRTQSLVCDDLDMSTYAIYNNPKAKPTTKKHKADLLEAFLGALYIDKDLDYCTAFCNACLFPRLQEFIMNQDWNDPKSKLQQCCLTLRSMEGGEPDIPMYKVIECLGPTNTRIYTVGVYFRAQRLAEARGHSIQEAEMNAAEKALSCAHELFPQLDHQKRVIAKSMRRKKRGPDGRNSPSNESAITRNRKRIDDKVPRAYRFDRKQYESSDESCHTPSDAEMAAPGKSNDDSGLDSDTSVQNNKFDNVQVSSLLSDMQKIKEDLIRRNEYEKLKEKCRRSDSDDD